MKDTLNQVPGVGVMHRRFNAFVSAHPFKPICTSGAQ